MAARHLEACSECHADLATDHARHSGCGSHTATPSAFINQPLTVYYDNPHGVSTDSLAGRHVRINVLEKEYLKESIPPALYRRRVARNYHYLGRHYLRRGQRGEGKQYLRQALQLNPLDLKNLFHYTLTLFR